MRYRSQVQELHKKVRKWDRLEASEHRQTLIYVSTGGYIRHLPQPPEILNRIACGAQSHNYSVCREFVGKPCKDKNTRKTQGCKRMRIATSVQMANTHLGLQAHTQRIIDLRDMSVPPPESSLIL